MLSDDVFKIGSRKSVVVVVVVVLFQENQLLLPKRCCDDPDRAGPNVYPRGPRKWARKINKNPLTALTLYIIICIVFILMALVLCRKHNIII